MSSIDLANLHDVLGLAILGLGAAVLLTTLRWSDVAETIRSAIAPRAPGISVDLREARWSQTSYANRVGLDLVIRVEVTNRSGAPWRPSLATVRGHRLLAVNVRELAPPAAPRESEGPSIAPGTTTSLVVHGILDIMPPADPAAPFVASLVLVDHQAREITLRLAARGPKGWMQSMGCLLAG